MDHLYALATTTAYGITADSKSKKTGDRSKEMESMDAFFEMHDEPDFLLLDNDDVPSDAKKDMEIKSSRLSLSTRYSLASRTSLSAIDLSKDSIETSRFEDHMRTSRANSSVRELLRGSGSDFFSNSRISTDGRLWLPGSRPQHASASMSSEPLNIDDSMEAPKFAAADDDDFAMHNDDGYDDDNDGPGFAFPSEDDDAVFEDAKPTEPRKHVSFAPSTALSQKKQDPYEMIDPDVETAKKRELRVGKTIKLPPGINTLPSGKRAAVNTSRPESGPCRRQAFRSLATDTFQATLAARKRGHVCLEDDEESFDGTDPSMPAVPLRGFFFGSEFAYIAKAAMKRRAAERRQRRLEQRSLDGTEVEGTLNAEGNRADDDDDDYGGGFPFGGDDDDDHDDEGDFGSGNDHQLENNTGLASLDDAFYQRNMRDDGGNTGDDEPQTFEELCRLHLGNLKENSNKYMNRSKLAKRVNEWQERMALALETELERQPFDIHDYGQNVIQLAENEVHRMNGILKDSDEADVDACHHIDFREIVRHQPQHEICRMFLATLSLCCSGNIEAVDNSGGDGSSLSLKLVSTKVDTPMEQYMAPSEFAARN